MNTSPATAPTFLPPRISSAEVTLALNVLKRRYDEMSVEDARKLRKVVIDPCMRRLRYMVIEGSHGGPPVDNKVKGSKYFIVLRLDKDIAHYHNEMKKFTYILKAFPVLDPDVVEKKNVKFEIHVGLSIGEKDALIQKAKPWDLYSSTCVVVQRDWTTIANVKQMENNKVELVRRAEVGRKKYKEKYGKELNPPKRWTYWEICDTLGITGYPEDVWA